MKTPDKPKKTRGRLGGGRKKNTKLSTQQLDFCERYAITGNGSRASRESGYHIQGYCKLLKDPMILAKIEELQKERREKFHLSADRVIEELCRIAFSNMDDFILIDADGTPIIDLSNTGRDEMAAISEITQDFYTESRGKNSVPGDQVKKTKIKYHDKLRALELLGRNLKLFDGVDDKATDNLTVAQKVRAALRAMMDADGA